jgi:ABC-type multidrug transport system fused ATPase/permease subunit
VSTINLINFLKFNNNNFSFFILLFFNLFSLSWGATQSDDFQLFITIFIILLISGLLISAAFALGLYFWYVRNNKIINKQQQSQQLQFQPIERRKNIFWTEV